MSENAVPDDARNAQQTELAEAQAAAEAALARLKRLQEQQCAEPQAAPAAPAPAPAAPAAATAAPAPSTASATVTPATSNGPAPQGPLSDADIDAIRAGYTFDEPALEIGALVNGAVRADVQVRIPLRMLNRHGLVAGATGTGKTKTLQGLAEQLSASGVPVFAADIKGDLSGIAVAGTPSDKLAKRTAEIGQNWQPTAFATEFYSLGGIGHGVPIRATVSSFGPLMLSRVLGLNETQESSLELVFHYADQHGLALVDLSDLRAVLTYLTGPSGKGELDELGGVSKATAGVILRELTTFGASGADAFFGEPEIDTREFLRTASDGRGIVSMLEVPGVADRPELFSTFLMWLLADLFNDLPEVGDGDKPKLVFFFDEAHLLFNGASKEFLRQITQTVRLIRSKGVGIFFVTQTPKDVPADVLAQLGSRVQHQLRAFTPEDAKALRATVSTYPKSGYDLEETLTQLGIGEAIVTVMNEKGAPSPVAWTRVRAPQGSMEPMPQASMDAAIASSPLLARYGTAVDPESARELLEAKMQRAADEVAAQDRAEEEARAADERAKQQARDDAAREKEQAREDRERAQQRAREDRERQREYDREVADARRESRAPTRTRTSTRAPRREKSVVEDVLGSSVGRTVVREVVRGVFGTLFKGRRR